MKCGKCNNTATVEFQPPVCNSCFCKIIEKRIRKNARLNNLIEKNKSISYGSELEKYFIESMVKSMPIELKKTKTQADTIDDVEDKFLQTLILKGKTQPPPISLFSCVTDEELETFAKIKNIEFKPKPKHKEINHMLEELHKKYPEIKFSLIKSIEQLRTL